TPDRIEGAGEYDTIRALGADITSCASIYYWPREHRDIGDNGKAGILHVKCVVADGELMLLSSANLTHQAFTVNMELGVLIRGGNIPAKVDQQFMSLINHNLLMML
ncbi:MAG: hypothetical protein EBZ36_16265, partial [Acidobacteria bacterium]|nr:hypothetical protein [Acidobacteriota bacterium]